MKKTILEIYALAICFTALIFLLVHASEGLYNLIGLAKPDLTVSSYTYSSHQSNDRYRESCCKKDKVRKNEKTITRLRLESYDIVLRSEARIRLQKLIHNLIYVLFSSIVLFLHWKIGNFARGNKK